MPAIIWATRKIIWRRGENSFKFQVSSPIGGSSSRNRTALTAKGAAAVVARDFPRPTRNWKLETVLYDQGSPWNSRSSPARHRPMEPGGREGARRLRALQLSRDPDADFRRHATVLAQRGRRDRHRFQRDVHLGGQGPRPKREAAVADVASREHRRCGARVHRAWSRQEGHAAEAVLHWAAVPARATAEGALSPVLPDWRGDHRAAERGQ